MQNKFDSAYHAPNKIVPSCLADYKDIAPKEWTRHLDEDFMTLLNEVKPLKHDKTLAKLVKVLSDPTKKKPPARIPEEMLTRVFNHGVMRNDDMEGMHMWLNKNWPRAAMLQACLPTPKSIQLKDDLRITAVQATKKCFVRTVEYALKLNDL